jgi:hypothetical protein
MNKSPRRILAVAAATAALVGGQVLVGAASAAPASGMQQEVDAYLAEHPDARQISENRIAIDGGAVTLAAPGQEQPRQVACDYGHLCIVDEYGDFYDYYYCGTYEFSGLGWGEYNNNQSAGTTAVFSDVDGYALWTSTAPDSGWADWTPVFYVSPC